MEAIQKIIDKYFEGETSLEEEKLLCDYFTSTEHIPSHLLSYASIFSAWKKESSFVLDASFEEKIMMQIAHTHKTQKIFLYSLSGIAASLLLGVFFLFAQDNKAYMVENGVRTDDEAAAMIAAEEVLDQVALPLQNSLQFIEPLRGLNSSEGSFEDMSKLRTGMKALDLPYGTEVITN